MKFVSMGPIDNNPAFVYIIRRQGISEQMLTLPWRIYGAPGGNELTNADILSVGPYDRISMKLDW